MESAYTLGVAISTVAGRLTIALRSIAMAMAIAWVWIKEGLYDKAYVAAHTVGFDAWKAYLLGEEDGVLAEVDAVVLAAGWGAAALLDGFDQTPRLSPVRGQANWIDGDVTVHPMAWGGYAVPTGQGVLFGATHDRGQADQYQEEGDEPGED